MDYILGIDQGGTKTTAVIADYKGNIISCGSGKGRVFDSAEGVKSSLDAIQEAYMSAIESTDISINQIVMIYAGLTGVDWPHEYSELRKALKNLFEIKNIKIVNDCIIAMRSGTEKPFGAAICAGTGLNVCIKSPDGKDFIYGYYIHDSYQGGSAIGDRAVKAVIDASIGLEPATTLTEVVMEAFKLSNVEELLFKNVNGQLGNKSKFLVPQVFDKANEGDYVAIKIIEEMATQWALYVVEGLRRFNMLNLDTEVVFAGSVLKAKSQILRDRLKRDILESASKVKIIDANYEPVVGAILMALDDLYCEGISEVIKQNLDRTCRKYNLIRYV